MKCRRYLRVHTGLVCLQASLATVLVVSGPAVAAVKVRPIVLAGEAQQHIQETNTVCGLVASTKYADSAEPKLTYLNLGRPYPNQVCTVVIPDSVRPKFKVRPEELFKDKMICVTGLITANREKPQIVIDDPFQIEVQEPATSTTSPPAGGTGK